MRQLTRGTDTSDCVSEETEAATFHTPVGEEVSFTFSKISLSSSNVATTGATSGAETAYTSGAPEFTPVVNGMRVTRSVASE